MIDPQNLPLHDIHLPAPIGWWPLAPGWWIALGAGLTALLVGGLAWWWWRRTRLRRRARQRLGEIARAFATHQDHHRLAVDLSMLCRQVGLQILGAAQGAAVTGTAWLTALDTLAADHFFSTGPGRILAEAPYDPARTYDASPLLAGLDRWLRALPAAHV